MSIISEKVSYLRGLAEGLGLDIQTKEGKLLSEIINVLGEIANDMDYLEESQDEVFDRVYDLEDELYGEEDGHDDDLDYFNEDEDEQFSISCPSCKHEFFLDLDDLEADEEIVCPNCDEEIELEFGCDCGCDDCGE